MKKLYFTLTLIMMLAATKGQDIRSFKDKQQDVDRALLAYSPKEALQEINQLLTLGNIGQGEINQLKAKKVEALQQAEMYNEALKLSKEVLGAVPLLTRNKLQVLLQRALIYEIVGELTKANQELDIVEEILLGPNMQKLPYQGIYLIRRASLYLTSGQYDLAREFTQKALNYGQLQQNQSITAQANRLLGFLNRKDQKQELVYFQKALAIWKSFNDVHDMAAMYQAIAEVKLKQGRLAAALAYLDTALLTAAKQPDYYTLSKAHLLRSQIFEQRGQLRQALDAYKKHKKYNEAYDISQKNIQVRELDFIAQLNHEKTKRQLLGENIKTIQSRNGVLLVLSMVLLLSLLALAIIWWLNYKKKLQILLHQHHISLKNQELNGLVAEKQLLLKELQHRVKNILSLILSFISFQKKQIKNAEDKERFEMLSNRINALSIVHGQLLYKESDTPRHHEQIRQYIHKIASSLICLSSKKINFEYDIEEIYLPLEMAMPLGMMINELVSNSLKYAKPAEGILTIGLEIYQINSTLNLHYFDNGANAHTQKIAKGLGFFIVENMVEQLNASAKQRDWRYLITIPN